MLGSGIDFSERAAAAACRMVTLIEHCSDAKNISSTSYINVLSQAGRLATRNHVLASA